MTARKLCLQVRWHFRQRSLYVTRPRSLRKKGQLQLPLFSAFSAWCLLKQKSAHFSRNSRNRRIADFSVVFRGDFQGKSGHRTARKIPRSITDRADYTLSDCCVSVSIRCSFSPVLPDVVPAPGSHNDVSLPLVRSLRSGFLHFPSASRCATSPGSISHTGRSFDWNNPSMN